MGIAAYSRGSRAISRYIDQQLREAREVKPSVQSGQMWKPPAGWFRSVLAERERKAHEVWLAEWNEDRRKRGLPTCDGRSEY